MRILKDQDAGDAGGTATAEASLGASETKPAADWRENLPAEVSSDEAIMALAKDVEAPEAFAKLAKSYGEVRKKATAAAIPTKDAPEDEWNTFWEHLGRPDAPDKYELPTEGMPEGFEPNDEYLNFMRERALKANVTKSQFAALVRAAAEYGAQAHGAEQQATEAQRIEWTKQIRGKLGAAFEQDVALARAAVMSFGGEELQKLLVEKGLDNHPAMVLAWAEAGRALAGDEILGRGAGAPLIPTKQEAEDQITKLMADDEFMKDLEQKHRPGHEPAMKKWRELHQAASPEPVETA